GKASTRASRSDSSTLIRYRAGGATAPTIPTRASSARLSCSEQVQRHFLPWGKPRRHLPARAAAGSSPVEAVLHCLERPHRRQHRAPAHTRLPLLTHRREELPVLLADLMGGLGRVDLTLLPTLLDILNAPSLLHIVPAVLVH